MATKKTAEIPTAKNVYEGEELVVIRLPLTREDTSDVFVRVNERTWMIQRGVDVKVPACVAEVLEHSEDAMRESLEFQEQHRSKN